MRKTICAFFQKHYGISAQLDPDESLCLPAASAPEPTSEPMEPELDPVDTEEWCIPDPSSSESGPSSSEGLVDDIIDAISELRSLMSKDLTD